MNKTMAVLSLCTTLLAATLLVVLSCSRDSALDSDIGATAGDLAQNFVDQVSMRQIPPPTFVETFDRRSNVGNWSFWGNPDNRVEVFEPHGGNPGAFIHATCDETSLRCLETYAPQLRTQLGVSSIFTGDYRTKKVTMVGVDLVVYGPDWINTWDRPLSLVLRNDNGTPDDAADDVMVCWKGSKSVPQVCGQFKEFVLAVPSQSETMPKDWGILANWGTGDDDADWNKVITDVSQINFFLGDPGWGYQLQPWELGFDNTRIWMDE